MWLGENLYYYEWIYLFSLCLEFFKQKNIISLQQNPS